MSCSAQPLGFSDGRQKYECNRKSHDGPAMMSHLSLRCGLGAFANQSPLSSQVRQRDQPRIGDAIHRNKFIYNPNIRRIVPLRLVGIGVDSRIAAARRPPKWISRPPSEATGKLTLPSRADIFNVKLQANKNAWHQIIPDTLNTIARAVYRRLYAALASISRPMRLSYPSGDHRLAQAQVSSMSTSPGIVL
jgi:hypothetical protein